MAYDRASSSGGYFSVILVCVFIAHLHIERVEGNDFPSLLVANATMGESINFILLFIIEILLILFESLSYHIGSRVPGK